jgi:2-polyprenyl-3-methyl-5-hydroxy-6-metoxy-1,4-benzoquinol methylase
MTKRCLSNFIRRFLKKTVQNRPYFYEFKNPNLSLQKAMERSEISSKDFGQFNKSDLFYYLFENVFYDKNAIIKIQSNYIKYLNKEVITQDTPVLDIGCGRGEFLNILLINNIPAVGVEVNKLEYELLRRNGFSNVVIDDGLSFLKKTKGKFGAITAIQVIEHMETPYFLEYIHAVYEKLVEGGMILVESVNPLCPISAANFWADITHIKPLHPDTVSFIFEYEGFKNVRLVYFTPLPIKRGLLANYPPQYYVGYVVIAYK